MSKLQESIKEATTVAMKAREKERVAVLRMVNAELKRVEVDERRELADEDVLTILKKMLKQRQDSLSQYEQAGRDDLAQQESFEIALVKEFMPAELSPEALSALVAQAVSETGASGMADMGKVMGAVKKLSQGQADLGSASALVKQALSEG